MNVHAMHAKFTSGLLLALLPLAALAAGPAPAAIDLDCQSLHRPTQREVSEWTGQHNFSQVYETRTRLMGQFIQACKRSGGAPVKVVLERGAPQARRAATVASAIP